MKKTYAIKKYNNMSTILLNASDSKNADESEK